MFTDQSVKTDDPEDICGFTITGYFQIIFHVRIWTHS